MQHQPRPAEPHELDEIVEFIAAEQQHPDRNIPYLGTEPAGIRAELGAVEPAWAATVRVVRAADGALIGAVVAEWDDVPGRAWIQGPWVRGADDAWNALARPLLGAAIEQVPSSIVDYEIAGTVENVRLARLAADLGWPAGEINHALVLEGAVAGAWEARDEGLRPAASDDIAALEPLHELEFPATYYSVPQLLERAANGEHVVLVADAAASGALLGYAAGCVQPDGEGYIDFVAVDPAARGIGLGRRLVMALSRDLLDRSTTNRLHLTVQDRRLPARALYASLGFRPDISFRGFRSVGYPPSNTSTTSPAD